MPLLSSILLVDVILPSFSNELLFLESLVFTRFVSLLCISCYSLKVSLRLAPTLLIILRIIVKLIIQSISLYVSIYLYMLPIYLILPLYTFLCY